MPFELFLVHCRNKQEIAKLNAFIRDHEVSTVQRDSVQVDGGAAWSFCIEYDDGSSGAERGFSEKQPKKETNWTDYKKVLSEEEFLVYLSLRDWRKETSERTNTPIYSILSNEQLASTVRNRCTTLADLRRIPGIGEGKTSLYGEGLLAALRASFAQRGMTIISDEPEAPEESCAE